MNMCNTLERYNNELFAFPYGQIEGCDDVFDVLEWFYSILYHQLLKAYLPFSCSFVQYYTVQNARWKTDVLYSVFMGFLCWFSWPWVVLYLHIVKDMKKNYYEQTTTISITVFSSSFISYKQNTLYSLSDWRGVVCACVFLCVCLPVCVTRIQCLSLVYDLCMAMQWWINDRPVV